jgi:AcrR family transcriptional regulator
MSRGDFLPSPEQQSRDATPPRRRRRRLLTVESILDAALSLIDETGELTMAALASRLGSTASSIYHHLDGRQAIIEALRDRIGASVPPPDDSDPDWGHCLMRWMRHYRDAFARHPRLIPLITSQSVTGDLTIVVYDRVVAILERAGVDRREQLLWISAVDNFVLGSALDTAAPDDVWRISHQPETPALNAAVAVGITGTARADAAFALGTEALITGLRARLAREQADDPGALR